jgi:chemotaxis protein methyltransferase CheR
VGPRVARAGSQNGDPAHPDLERVVQHGTSASAWDIRILASDIDTDVLERAKSGVYPASTAAAIPRPLLVTWFLRGRGDQEGFVRVRDELRRLIVFRRISLIEEPWPIRTRFDAVFCRNVMIYFDRPTRERLLDRLVRQTADGGLLFLGHSEGVFGPVNGIEHVGDTIYQRRTP